MQKQQSHDGSDWAEGPRPSFFGQLRRSRDGGERVEIVRRPSAPETVAGHDAAEAADADTVWADPFAQTARTDGEAFLAQEREEYVRLQFNQSFESDFRDRQLLAVSTTLLIAGVCWHYVPLVPLLLWFGARVLLAMVRLLGAEGRARRRAAREAGHAPARWLHALPMLRGIALGSSVLLFFGRIPIGLQYLCWMMLAAAVTLPIHSLALDPGRMRAFVHAIFITVLACVLYRILSDDPQLEASMRGRHYEFWFVALPLVHWFVVLHIGKRIQSSARKGFELEFYKKALIDSLAAKRTQAEDAVQTKNRFLATAAHDMRQPVMALSIYAEHLREKPEDGDVVVQKIAKAAAAVNRLFDSLFDLARMDNEQLKPRVEPLDISEVMHDLRDQFEPIAKENGIELRMRTVRRQLRTDPVLVRRMIGNVVSNAIKYTPAGKKVLIAARARSTGVVTVEVWDQGSGIAPGELRKIFLEFYKVEGAASNAEGFGLGLSIVARLAHALNTRIRVRSHPGSGSVFRLVIDDVRAKTR